MSNPCCQSVKSVFNTRATGETKKTQRRSAHNHLFSPRYCREIGVSIKLTKNTHRPTPKSYFTRKSRIFPIRKHLRQRASYDSFSPSTTVS